MQDKLKGFTLVEVLVISPIIILFIGMFISLLVSLTGESLVVRERNVAIYDTQEAVDTIQESVSKGIGFLTRTEVLQSPQGSSDVGNEAFTYETYNSPDTLIVKLAATNKSPTDPTRSLVYKGAGACDSKNPIYFYYEIYMVRRDLETADAEDNALFKRTILPSGAACSTVWQRGSCRAESMTTSNRSLCQRKDEKLVGGISDFQVDFFKGTTAVVPEEATDVNTSINISKSIAGSEITYGSTSRAQSTNVQPAQHTQAQSGTPAANPSPDNPAIQVVRSDTSPYRTTITWTRIGNATGYRARYTVGGGAVQTVDLLQTGSNPTFDINASHRKQAVVLTEVKVLTSSGELDYGTIPAISPIPNWNECTFQNGWHNYKDWYGGNTFTTGGYTKTSSKIVALKGLVRTQGSIGNTVCTLPEGFRPKFANEKLIFQVATGNGSNWGRVDILPGGQIVVVNGGTDWVSLDGIMFIADDSNYTWTTPGWQNGWTNYNSMYGGNAHASLRATTDSEGRRHVQGLGGYSGTAPIGVAMTCPGATSRTLHYPAVSGSGPGIVQASTSGCINTRSTAASWQSLQLIYRQSTATGWQNIPFSSNWGNYDINNWPTMQCHRGADDIVIVKGLVAHNDPTDGNNAAISGNIPCGKFSSGQGYGQAERLIFSPWLSNETTGRVDLINGEYIISQGTQDPWTALDGIRYVAD